MDISNTRVRKWLSVCNGYNRLRPILFSQVCKNYSSKCYNNDNETFLIEEDKKVKTIKKSTEKKRCDNCVKNTSIKSEKLRSNKNIEYSYSFRSLRGRCKKNEKNNTPVLPAVLMTFDKYPIMEKNLQEMQDTKVDIDEIDRNLRKILFELQRKRALLDDYQQELNEAILKQQDLERQLKNEKQKNSNDEYRNIILQNAAETLEDERQKNSKELIKLKVQFELAIAERDSLRNQVRSQCLEINNLKRQVDDLSSKHECHNDFQNEVSEQLNKIKNSINLVNDLIIPLRKKQEELANAAQATNISENLLLSAKQLQNQIVTLKKQRDAMEQTLIIKSAELSKLQQLMMEDSFCITKMNDNNSVLGYWEETCKDLKHELTLEKEGNEKLTNTLNINQENCEYLRKKIFEIEEKNSEMEKKLELFNKNKTDVVIQTETTEQIIEIVDLVKSESMDI